MGIPASLKKIRSSYRVTSVLAGAAVFAGAAFFASGGAGADNQPVPRTFDSYQPAGDAGPRAGVVTPDALESLPNVRQATTTEYKLGKNGPAFESQPRVQPRIVGGEKASVSQHPYIVGIETLFYVLRNGQFEGFVSTCTGTVISATKVLTAAHCAVNSPLGTTYVIAGRDNLRTTTAGFTTVVRSTYTHQSFARIPAHSDAGTPLNDMAVLTLRDALPDVYTPIAIAAQGDESVYADNTPAQIVGYGVTGQNAGDHGILRNGTVPIRSDSACAGAFADYRGDIMACAGAAGVDTCNGDSGGPLIVTRNGVKTQVGITSWGPIDCGSSYGAYAQVSAFGSLIRADLARKSPANLDWTGDGHSDLIGRNAGGDLVLYSGTGLLNGEIDYAFNESSRIGVSFGGYRKLFRVWNWNNDNRPSVFGVSPNGDLMQYKSNGEGEFANNGVADLIGTGWNRFNDIMITNNWTGNGRPNLLGREPNGDLYLYTSDGNGGWENGGLGQRIGVGWSMFNTILTPGDWLGDGRQALIGRTPGGDLRLYQSDGQGGWVNGLGVPIGTGWNIFSIFMSPGDVNGDNLVDMIGIEPTGGMRLYPTDGRGNWLNSGIGITIGSGWNMFNAVF